MKKNILLTLLMSLCLSSCILIENPSSNESNSGDVNYEESSSNLENSTQDTESSSNKEDVSNKDSSSSEENVDVDPNSTSINLGDYGDYYTSINNQYKGIELYKKYNELTKEIESSQNGIIKTKYQKGLLEFFNINNKISINIDVSNNELLKINEYHSLGNEESYRICDVNITINDLIIHYEDVGIRLKGNTSRGYVVDGDKLNLRHYKLNFAETFDDEFRNDVINWTDENALAYREDRTFFGLEKLDIRWNRNQESTYIREYYVYEMYRNNGMLAPHTNPFNLVFNVDGSKQNAGIYLAVEPIDKDFLKRNLAKSYRDGDLYKMGWTSVGATLSSTDASLFGVETQVVSGDRFNTLKYPYDLKTNKKTSNHEDIKNFINLLNNTSSNNFKSMLLENSKYDMLMKYFALSYLVGDPDDLRGNFNNTYLYFIPSTDTTNALAVFIPTDNDRALGSSGGTNPGDLKHNVYTDPFAKKTGYSENNMPLFKKSIFNTSNTEIRNDYLNAIKCIIDSSFMSVDTFKSYYNKAKNHYGELTTLGEKFNDRSIAFSLNENNDVNNNWNLSIEKYLTEKLKTFNKALENDEEETPNPNPLGYDIVFHYHSNEKTYEDLELWIWSNAEGVAYDWSGIDDFGGYYTLNSLDYNDPSRIGIIVKSSGHNNWSWQTHSKYINKNDFVKDENGIVHIYSINDKDNNLLLYSSKEEALGIN